VIVHLILDEIVYIENMPEINEGISFVYFFFLQCLLLIDWQPQFIEPVLVVLFKVLFHLRMCIFQWDIADHQIGPLLLSPQDLLHVNRTPVILAHIRDKACLRVFFLVVYLQLRKSALPIVVNIVAAPSVAVDRSHHEIVYFLCGQVVNQDIALIVHRQFFEFGINLPLGLHRFCLVSVHLASGEFSRAEAATIRLTNGLTPLIDFIIPLWSNR